MSIYTGRGDDGETDLRDMTRVSKASPRIEAYGTVDELNALVGTIRPTEYDDIDDCLQTVQNHLHIIQAEFATPEPEADDPAIRSDHIDTLETWIDDFDEELEPLTSFILPTGSDAGARLHHARTVCRRAERRAVALAEAETINEDAVQYLNRLSDALFTFARVVNSRDGELEDAPTYDETS
ncbi:cob(I)yrinic acid a,c-diamide adenosyltransferase [Natronolimnobius sp. AArcel1]|uniref:cob(I)yrinic acid a,c-diamide adenosyltransferase n=1 Tax=Natronolimnobius sp. AArcel1 TaxID=1679093 RepID=UPI0013EC8907|nr:cob(I)yrinic acid a,c-diamide adenosyltransferase [Natronolimnobius sp. AArcel1]NGM69237.1 cob(I)yrinic acid a,c-diamide adenosyltransferase [Natronolimnobius sp. AArcel1]